MTDETRATLEGTAIKSSWAYFEKSDLVTYEPVNRFGWPDVGMNGGGDPDWIDYKVVGAEEDA